MSEDMQESGLRRPGLTAPSQNALSRRLRDWAARRLPSVVESSLAKELRERWREKDLERIPASIPDAAQHVALKSLLAAEFYTPAHAVSLFQAFEKMGWHSAGTSAFSLSSAEWVARSRRGSEGGSWINLGMIVRPKNKLGFRNAAEVKLPNGFESARAELFSITPSLSCIVVTFDAAEAEGRYETVARSSLGTEVRKTRRGLSMLEPRGRKRKAIADAREGFRRDMLEWFKTNLPGAFAASGNLELFPTCEVLFLDGVRTPENAGSQSLWIDFLGLERNGVEWACTGLPGLQFTHPVSSLDSQSGHAAVSIERRDLRATDNSMFGGDSDQAYTTMLSMSLPGLVCHWALNPLLRLYRQELNAVRDGQQSLGHPASATDVLRRLQRMMANSIDVSLMAAELPDSFNGHVWESLDFLSEADSGHPMSLNAALTARSRQLLGQLAASDRASRELLVQQGNLANALEAIATQRIMSWLTAAMTALTVAILILTAVMAAPVLVPELSAPRAADTGETGK